MEKADDEQVTAGRASRSESSDDYGDDYRYRDKKSGKQRKCEKMKHKKRGKSSRKKRREKGDVSSDSSAEDDRTRRNEKVERHERKRSREEHRDPADEAAKLFKDVDRGLFLKVEKRLGKRPWLVSVGSAGSGGRRALHLAAAQGHFQLALLLIRRGADVDAVDALGDTALHAACRAQQWAVAELLVERGALQEVENEAGERPVAMGLGAAMRERGQEEEVKRQRVEQLRKARRLVEEEREWRQVQERQDKEWREKILEESSFEHLEGWATQGWGSRLEEGPAMGGGIFDWAEVDDELGDEDWWAELGRQMRERHHRFASKDATGNSTSSKAHAKESGSTTGPSRHSPPKPRWQGPEQEGGFAWERGGRSAAGADSGGDTGTTSSNSRGKEFGPWGLGGAHGYQERMAVQAGSWDIFMKKAAKKEVLRYRDIPWPEPPEGGDLAMEALMLPIQLVNDAAAKKKMVREALRRWHPDKFQQRFEALLFEPDREKTLERVKAISQSLTALV